jgi:DNA-binding NarL/FixJ family response regulator
VIRVALADDQQLVRAGLRVLLETEEGFAVVGEAGDGAAAVALVRETRPDVAVMDVRMPGVDGLTALETIVADPSLAATAVLVLTTFDLDEYVYRALRAGAAGFLLKDAEPADLVRAIALVARGDALLAPAVTRRLIAEFAARPAPVVEPTRLDVLTPREREVLTLVGAGLTNDEIAARLVISAATARTHVGRLLTKLDARDRAALVVIAYESGVVVPRTAAPR